MARRAISSIPAPIAVSEGANAEPQRDRGEWTAHTRGGWIVLWLKTGERLKESEIAAKVAITPQWAGRLMTILETRFPIVKADDGCWQWMEENAGKIE